jgi:hypothetical protein
MGRRAVTAGALALATVASAPSADAQMPRLRGYGLNVVLAAADGPFTAAGVQDLQRVRLMLSGPIGPVALDAAYEHVLVLTSAPDLSGLAGIGQPAGSGDWLPLQGNLVETDNVRWRHRVDRLAAAVEHDVFAASVGRQTISWATTLFLTPADPFAPFDPADPFREYRSGVDAVRVRGFPGPISEVEAVVRPATFDSVTTMTALARARVATGRLELSGWGGIVHDDPSLAATSTLTFAGAVARAEVVLRWVDTATVARVAVGVDRSFELWERTLYLVVEYQHDGFGAADADELPAVLGSEAFRRGELQVLGRNEFAVQASYQVHPLAGVSLVTLWNASDRSVLLGPGVSWDALSFLSLRAGAYFGLGDGRTALGLPASEYGAVPASGYVSGSVFF